VSSKNKPKRRYLPINEFAVTSGAVAMDAAAGTGASKKSSPTKNGVRYNKNYKQSLDEPKTHTGYQNATGVGEANKSFKDKLKESLEKITRSED
jgi:hypothetical protein